MRTIVKALMAQESTTEPPSLSINETTAVPVVDFSRFLHGSDVDKVSIARQIDEAFCNIGFVYLQNHGISQQKLNECFEWVRLISAGTRSEETSLHSSLANMQNPSRAKSTSLFPKPSKT